VLAANAAAHTDADFAVAEGEARAGDPVHFSITGTKGQYTYELEIGNLDVVEDTVASGNVSGEFTLPHLGNSQKTAVVKAVIRESRHKTTVTRKVRYLGPALPPPPRVEKPATAEKPAPDPAPEPAAQVPASQPSGGGAPAASPGPSSSPAAAAQQHQQQAAPSSRAERRRAAARRRSARRGNRRKTATRLTTSVPSAGDRRAGHRRAAPRRKGRTGSRPRPRTAPLFDGVPERGVRGGTPGGRDRYAAPNAIVPVALVSATHAPSTGGGGLRTAILVPGFMGIAGLALAGTALHRKRRLHRSS